MEGLLKLDKIPSDYMLNAELKNPIYLVKIQRNRDGGKCQVCPIYGSWEEAQTIDRYSLLSNYRTVSGKKLKLSKLYGGRVYRVQGDKQEYKVLPLPSGLSKLGDKVYRTPFKGARYLIEVGNNRKVIPNKVFYSLFEIRDNPQEAVNRLHTQGSQQKKAQTPVDYHYVAVGKFVIRGKLQGFRLLNKATGKTADLSIRGVRKLVSKGYVDNLVFSQGNNRGSYFRGNGMTLAEIPNL